MAVRDQYYTPKSTEFTSSTEALADEHDVTVRLQNMFEVDWIRWDEVLESEKNITILVHAPGSLLDMRRITAGTTDFIGLRGESGGVAKTEEGLRLGLLPCKNLGSDWLVGYIEETSLLLNYAPDTINRLVEEVGRDYKGYGAFQPVHLGRFNDDDGVDPALFSVAMALKLKKETDENGHVGRLCVVSHPDQLFFIANGDKEVMPKIAQKLGDFYREVGVEMFVENPIFVNPLYISTLGWMQDPERLANVIPSSDKSVGLCIDGEHLESLGYDGKRINDVLISLLDRKYNVALHVDRTFSINDPERPYILTAYKNALPVAYEPRGV